MFKRLVPAVALSLVLSAGVSAAEWNIDQAHSSIGFSVTHMVISKVPGHFSKFEGTASFDPANVAGGQVAITIQTASISTDNEKRDDHLRSADFFDAETYPEITFTSTKVIPGDGKKFQIIGDLTIRGVTKPVTFDAELIGTVKDPMGSNRAGFSATTTINRQDFGVNWSRALDSGGLVAGDKVDINVSLELVEAKAGD